MVILYPASGTRCISIRPSAPTKRISASGRSSLMALAMDSDGLAAEFAGKAEMRYALGCNTKGDNREGFAEALGAGIYCLSTYLSGRG